MSVAGQPGATGNAGSSAGGSETGVSAAERLEQVRRAAPPEFAELLRGTSAEELVAMQREGVRRLGTYRARVTKQERVHQKLLPAQTFELLVQPWPQALRLEYVAGVGAGRKVVWTEKRPKEVLLREGGPRGKTPVSVDIDSSLAHRDTNHNVTEFGFSPILEILGTDLRNATQYGGHQRSEEGLDVSGRYCMTLTAPVSAQGLYARSVRLCIDRELSVPVTVEIYDASGFLERYTYSNVRADQQLQPGLFDGL